MSITRDLLSPSDRELCDPLDDKFFRINLLSSDTGAEGTVAFTRGSGGMVVGTGGAAAGDFGTCPCAASLNGRLSTGGFGNEEVFCTGG